MDRINKQAAASQPTFSNFLPLLLSVSLMFSFSCIFSSPLTSSLLLPFSLSPSSSLSLSPQRARSHFLFFLFLKLFGATGTGCPNKRFFVIDSCQIRTIISDDLQSKCPAAPVRSQGGPKESSEAFSRRIGIALDSRTYMCPDPSVN